MHQLKGLDLSGVTMTDFLVLRSSTFFWNKLASPGTELRKQCGFTDSQHESNLSMHVSRKTNLWFQTRLQCEQKGKMMVRDSGWEMQTLIGDGFRDMGL